MTMRHKSKNQKGYILLSVMLLMTLMLIEVARSGILENTEDASVVATRAPGPAVS